ncbi:nicotinamide riboside transporter PnuC [bacterium]|nr:MAG: nicotinamide riboside transporter PnuC [bacterium]
MKKANWGIVLWGIGALGCLALVVGAATHHLPIGWAEAWGFATGLWCVALVMRNNVWNFPIGIINNIFFFALFFSERLYNDMTLQIVYFAFGLAGWYSWVYGGRERTPLPISRATPKMLAATVVGIAIATPILMMLSQAFNGAAPLWDALTTAISLGAQFLLNGKRLENWWFWIVADAIYVPLYLSRGLGLTAALFALFLVIAITGLFSWKREVVAA